MVTKQLVTADQFWEMPGIPGKRFELVRGEVVEVPFAGYIHALLVRALWRLLDTFAVEHDLGETFGDGLGFLIVRMPDSVRAPDVSFIARERIPAEGFGTYVPFAPDLAVEIVSPGDRVEEIHDKIQQYLAGGTLLVWVVWPKSRTVTVHERGGIVREFGSEDELDGGDVLPGFRVRVGDLFADVE